MKIIKIMIKKRVMIITIYSRKMILIIINKNIIIVYKCFYFCLFEANNNFNINYIIVNINVNMVLYFIKNLIDFHI